MKNRRRILTALAALQLIAVLLLTAVGGFADDGAEWRRAILTILQPTAAILLLMALQTRWPLPAPLMGLAQVVLVIDFAALIGLTAATAMGTIQGDWWLLLSLAVIPMLGLGYLLDQNAAPTRRPD